MDSTKSFLLKLFLLTLANLTSFACFVVSAIFAGLQNNYIAAAFPALLALVLFFLQPWFLVLFIAAWAFWLLLAIPFLPDAGVILIIFLPLTAFLSALITNSVYNKWYERGKLDWLVHQSPKKLGLCGGGFFLAGLLLSYAVYRDFPPQHRQGDFLEYRIFGNRLLDTQTLYRENVSRAELPSVLKPFGMGHTKTGTLPSRFWQQPPYWWRRPPGALEEYISGGFSIDGPLWRGDHEAAVYDPKTEMLYVWEQSLD